MDIIKIKINLYAQIVPLFVKYVDKLLKINKYIYDMVEDIKDYLKKIDIHIKHLQTISLNSPENAFETIQIVNNIDNS